MARASISAISVWRRRSLTIPPQSPIDWVRLAAWELGMGGLVCALVWAGSALIRTAPDRIIMAEDLSGCYATVVVRPCEVIVYRTGAMNAAFSALAGMVMIVAALWLLWELWDTMAPKPITDDFLRLLHHSFARDWRNPRTWPWARLLWAYGFTLVGVATTLSIALLFWSVLAPPARAPVTKVETSQDFRVSP